MTKTTIGRIVLFYQGDFEAAQHSGLLSDGSLSWEQQNEIVEKRGAHAPGVNGARYHPAIITQVHSADCVNLTVFFADGTTASRSSCTRLPDEAFADSMHCVNSGWVWPSRE